MLLMIFKRLIYDENVEKYKIQLKIGKINVHLSSYMYKE